MIHFKENFCTTGLYLFIHYIWVTVLGTCKYCSERTWHWSYSQEGDISVSKDKQVTSDKRISNSYRGPTGWCKDQWTDGATLDQSEGPSEVTPE